MLLRKRWDVQGRRHRPLKICGACRRVWPCPDERQARMSLDEANEAVRSSIAATLEPFLAKARERAADPRPRRTIGETRETF